eukprot:205201_1
MVSLLFSTNTAITIDRSFTNIDDSFQHSLPKSKSMYCTLLIACAIVLVLSLLRIIYGHHTLSEMQTEPFQPIDPNIRHEYPFLFQFILDKRFDAAQYDYVNDSQFFQLLPQDDFIFTKRHATINFQIDTGIKITGKFCKGHIINDVTLTINSERVHAWQNGACHTFVVDNAQTLRIEITSPSTNETCDIDLVFFTLNKHDVAMGKWTRIVQNNSIAWPLAQVELDRFRLNHKNMTMSYLSALYDGGSFPFRLHSAKFNNEEGLDWAGVGQNAINLMMQSAADAMTTGNGIIMNSNDRYLDTFAKTIGFCMIADKKRYEQNPLWGELKCTITKKNIHSLYLSFALVLQEEALEDIDFLSFVFGSLEAIDDAFVPDHMLQFLNDTNYGNDIGGEYSYLFRRYGLHHWMPTIQTMRSKSGFINTESSHFRIKCDVCLFKWDLRISHLGNWWMIGYWNRFIYHQIFH